MYSPKNRKRKSVRLPGYDYGQAGAYFVTLCSSSRLCLFGNIVVDSMNLNEVGEIVWGEWMRSAEMRTNMVLDAFQIMPNHLHGIVMFENTDFNATDVGAHSRAPFSRPPRSLGSFIAGFKSATTKRINEHRGSAGIPVWQRNYFERVIREDEELTAIRQYIADNPAKWAEDVYYPQ